MAHQDTNQCVLHLQALEAVPAALQEADEAASDPEAPLLPS